IPHTLMKELDLSLGEDIPHSVYISPQILERKPICGGITIENKEEIIIAKSLNKDQETQTDLTNQQILNQVNQLQQEDKLNQQTIIGLQEEFLEAQGNQNQELQDQITTLVGERDNIQQELNNRQTEIRRLNNALQTAQQEKERIERDLNTQIGQLTTQRDNLQTRIKNLEREKQELNRKVDEITRLKEEKERLRTERDARPNITPEHLNRLNREVGNLKQELNDLITSTQNLLGIDDLNNLPVLPEGETLITLIARPTQAQLQDKQNEVGRKNDEITELNRTIKKLEDEKKVLKD
ncbi:19106_t:CDS:2, partial [Racocetra persica]